MQEGSVGRVDPGGKGLQPIAFQQALECKAMRVWRRKTIHISQRWRIAHAQIGKDDAVDITARITGLVHLTVERTARGLRRLLQTAAVHIKQPAMEGTTNTAVFKTPKT